MTIINVSASKSAVFAPLAGLVKYRRTVDVPDADAAALIASGHFREATEPEIAAAAKRADQPQED